MDHKSRLLRDINKNGGTITTAEAVSKGIRKNAFRELVNEGKIQRISQGLYGFPEETIDEYLYYSSRLPSGIFSHATALYLWNLTTKIPTDYFMTIKSGSNVSRIKERGQHITFYYVQKELFHLGLTETESPFGRKIRVYDQERCILDIVKNKDKVDKQVFTESLKNYFSSSSMNLPRLIEYAKLMNLKAAVTMYTEVLL